MTKPTITSALVDKILALDYASLPPEAIDMAKAVTLDGLAVMIAGANEPLASAASRSSMCARWAARRRRR